jgi:hypothetical protein
MIEFYVIGALITGAYLWAKSKPSAEAGEWMMFLALIFAWPVFLAFMVYTLVRRNA